MATRGDREYAEIMGTGFPKWKVGDVIKMKPARGPAGMTGKIIKVISPPQESIYLTRYKIDGELGDWLKKHTEDPTGFDILAANSRARNEYGTRYIDEGDRVFVVSQKKKGIVKSFKTVKGPQPIISVKYDDGSIGVVDANDLRVIPNSSAANSREAKNDADPYLSEKLKLMIRQGAVSEVAGGKPMPGDVVFEYRGKRYYTDKDSAHMVKQFSDAGLVKMHNSCGVRSTNAEARNTALPIGTIGVSDSTILWRMIDGGRDEPYHDEYQKRLDRMNQRDIPEDTVAILKKYGYRFKNAQNCGVRSTIPVVNAAINTAARNDMTRHPYTSTGKRFMEKARASIRKASEKDLGPGGMWLPKMLSEMERTPGLSDDEMDLIQDDMYRLINEEFNRRSRLTAKNSAARNAKVKGIGPIQTEDDIVAVYDPKGNQVYKGEWDYCDLKDSDSTYDPSTKTYKILSPSFYKGYLLAKIG